MHISSKTEAHSQKKTVRTSQTRKEITQYKRLDYWEIIRIFLMQSRHKTRYVVAPQQYTENIKSD